MLIRFFVLFGPKPGRREANVYIKCEAKSCSILSRIGDVFITEIKLDLIKLKKTLFTGLCLIAQDVITNGESLNKGGGQETNCYKRFHVNCCRKCLIMNLSIYSENLLP